MKPDNDSETIVNFPEFSMNFVSKVNIFSAQIVLLFLGDKL